jgi:hypothetical protein
MTKKKKKKSFITLTADEGRTLKMKKKQCMKNDGSFKMSTLIKSKRLG